MGSRFRSRETRRELFRHTTDAEKNRERSSCSRGEERDGESSPREKNEYADFFKFDEGTNHRAGPPSGNYLFNGPGPSISRSRKRPLSPWRSVPMKEILRTGSVEDWQMLLEKEKQDQK